MDIAQKANLAHELDGRTIPRRAVCLTCQHDDANLCRIARLHFTDPDKRSNSGCLTHSKRD